VEEDVRGGRGFQVKSVAKQDKEAGDDMYAFLTFFKIGHLFIIFTAKQFLPNYNKKKKALEILSFQQIKPFSFLKIALSVCMHI